MGLRTVRLNEEEEAILEDLRKKTGHSISEVLKRGLRSYDTYVNGIRLGGRKGESAGEVFRRIMARYDEDTPEAPYAAEPGTLPRRRHKEAVVEIIRERHDAERALRDAREALDRLSRTLAG
ncbi:hypothetical protein [Candidatus Palauibacter soopunensis]|uniref:hypothetical protein n=1 Tax=Candidatus Palauibacter soopunensis TaxID=3056739 RepID=UPI0023A419F1|nr:hypothetical protein [Candidatus Palauibacter soopunensis]MDE2878145.1 hypothetical protein [Candidatus Palauibacter soopunensis]